MQQTKLTFIGAGNMAQAIIKGLIKSGYASSHITATGRTPEKLAQLQKDTGISVTTDNQQAVQEADIIVLGIKPQMIAHVMTEISPVINPSQQLIISLAAGVTVATLNSYSATPYAIVRCMPNTPALIGLGASGLFANALVDERQKQLTQHIVDAVGISIWLTEEVQIDVVTGVSGSGPAYYFLLMEAMIEAAQTMGLTETQAKALVLQTALGAATMAYQSDQSGTSTTTQLRTAVTSPNGTTQSALESFANNDYKTIVHQAMQAAQKRALELSDKTKKPAIKSST